MAHGSLDVCSMTIPKCVVGIVICSVLTQCTSSRVCCTRYERNAYGTHSFRLFAPSNERSPRSRAHVSTRTRAFCSWLVSILQFFFPVVCAQLMEHLLNLVIIPTSGTCRTAILTTPLKLVEARVPRSVIEWFLRSFSIHREDPMLRVLNSFSFESEVDVLLHGDSVVRQYVVFSPPDVRQRISV